LFRFNKDCKNSPNVFFEKGKLVVETTEEELMDTANNMGYKLKEKLMGGEKEEKKDSGKGAAIPKSANSKPAASHASHAPAGDDGDTGETCLLTMALEKPRGGTTYTGPIDALDVLEDMWRHVKGQKIVVERSVNPDGCGYGGTGGGPDGFGLCSMNILGGFGFKLRGLTYRGSFEYAWMTRTTKKFAYMRIEYDTDRKEWYFAGPQEAITQLEDFVRSHSAKADTAQNELPQEQAFVIVSIPFSKWPNLGVSILTFLAQAGWTVDWKDFMSNIYWAWKEV
jgi:hypothetical protein